MEEEEQERKKKSPEKEEEEKPVRRSLFVVVGLRERERGSFHPSTTKVSEKRKGEKFQGWWTLSSGQEERERERKKSAEIDF